MTLCYENEEYVVENPIPEIKEENATLEELGENKKHVVDDIKVACIMIATMTLDL